MKEVRKLKPIYFTCHIPVANFLKYPVPQFFGSQITWIKHQETPNKIFKHTQFFHVWNSQETCYFLSFTFRELIVSSWFLLWCSKSIQFFVQTPYCYSIIWCLNFFVCNKYWKIHDTVFAKFLFPILRTKKE